LWVCCWRQGGRCSFGSFAPLAASFKVAAMALYRTWLVNFSIYGVSGFSQHRVAANAQKFGVCCEQVTAPENNSLTLVIFRLSKR
jgi:hypothetical protein